MQLCVSSSYLVSEFSFGQNQGSFCHLIKSPKLLPRLRCPQGYNQVSGFIYQALGVNKGISPWNFITVSCYFPYIVHYVCTRTDPSLKCGRQIRRNTNRRLVSSLSAGGWVRSQASPCRSLSGQNGTGTSLCPSNLVFPLSPFLYQSSLLSLVYHRRYG